MTMTEKQAKTKWCPFVRVIEEAAPSAGPPANRFSRDGAYGLSVGSRCIASECMAWRKYGRSEGFCGLAGRP